MKIGLDFDGVITDCGSLKSHGAKALFGVDIPPAKFKKELVVGKGILTLDQYREVQLQVYCTPQFGRKMQAVEGMKDGLAKLQKKHDVHIVTSRDTAALEVAKTWLNKNNMSIPIVGVGYNISKMEASAGSDIFVDDDIDKLMDLKGTVPYLFLFSWGYNMDNQLPPEIKRVEGWKHLVEEIESLE